MQSKDEMIEIVKFMLEQQKLENDYKLEEQKKEHDSQMINIRISLSNQIKSNIDLKETVGKQDSTIRNLTIDMYKLKEENNTLKGTVQRLENVTIPIMPIKNISSPVQILKVDSDDDDSYTDSQQRSVDGNSYDSQNDDDKYDNVGFMPLINDDVRSYPWQPGRGFLDTFAYPFACREHKRDIDALKEAAYEGDHERLSLILKESKEKNKHININGRGMADSLCSRINGFYDKTALILASEEGHSKCVQILLNNQADIYKVDRENLTALDYAQANAHHAVVYILKKHNAIPGQEVIAQLDKNESGTKLKIN
jgi:hypothetical protein